MVQLDVLLHVVSPSYILEVLVNLGASGVELGPIWIGSKSILIAVRWDIYSKYGQHSERI